MSSGRLLAILFIFFLAAACVSRVQAHIFAFGDDENEFSVSFPDTWDTTHNQKPDDKLTILAPNNGDGASCRVRVRDDQRFMVYPTSYGQSIQQTYYSKDFWETYLNEYDSPFITQTVNGLQLGRMPAGRAEANYTSTLGTPMQKHAVMMGGVFQGHAYILECSAAIGAFDHWRGQFAAVMDSFRPNVTGNGRPESYYRNFLSDPLLVINRQAHDDRTLYY